MLITLLSVIVIPFALNGSDKTRRLLDAIAAVESDMGVTSKNIYQIQPEFISDVNRIQRKLERIDGKKRTRFHCEDVTSKARSEKMILVMWDYYGKRIPGGATYENLSKLHRVGFKGLMKRRSIAEAYWKRVRRKLK